MPVFHYKAQKSSGEIYEGRREAADKFSLSRDLKKEGESIISISEDEVKSKGSILQSLPFFGGISFHEKIVLARNLGNMLEAGLPISRALTVMERQGKSNKLRSVVASLNAEIRKGNSFNASLKSFPDIFPQIMVSMVKAGEESGTLSESLKLVAHQMDKTYALKRKVRGAMVYPAIILSVMVIIGVLMLMFVVPSLTSTFKELKVGLPLTTQAVIMVSEFLRDHTAVALILLVVTAFAFYSFGRTKIGKLTFDWLTLRIPLIGKMVKETNTARTARTISSLISSGVELVEGLKITGEVVQNYYYKTVLKEAEETIQKGNPLSKVFAAHENLYPPLLGEMVAIGEETGKLGDMFNNVAQFYENEVDQQTKDLSTVIEPFLMVFIGAAVGFFAISMISPIYSVFDTIN